MNPADLDLSSVRRCTSCGSIGHERDHCYVQNDEIDTPAGLTKALEHLNSSPCGRDRARHRTTLIDTHRRRLEDLAPPFEFLPLHEPSAFEAFENLFRR